MTKETLKQAQDLYNRIEVLRFQRKQYNEMLDEARENGVIVRVRGIEFDIPKAVFRTEVQQRKNDLESQLTTLQNEFDAL